MCIHPCVSKKHASLGWGPVLRALLLTIIMSPSQRLKKHIFRVRNLTLKLVPFRAYVRCIISE